MYAVGKRTIFYKRFQQRYDSRRRCPTTIETELKNPITRAKIRETRNHRCRLTIEISQAREYLPPTQPRDRSQFNRVACRVNLSAICDGFLLISTPCAFRRYSSALFSLGCCDSQNSLSACAYLYTYINITYNIVYTYV